MSDEPLLLTPEKAAELLGIGRTIMFRLIAEGSIKSVKIGRRRLVPRQALESYVDQLMEEA